jgi:hypothetical protein
MANEMTINASLAYQKNGVIARASVVNNVSSVAGNNIEANSAYLAPTADTALPLGGITNPRWLWMQNNDPTNFVTVKTAVAGTAIIKLLPGDISLLPLAPGITAPSTQADTAPCSVNYQVFPI